jgi:hypothetical protein
MSSWSQIYLEHVFLDAISVNCRAGMLKVAGTHEVELAWEPPKGDFTKYVLSGTADRRLFRKVIYQPIGDTKKERRRE